MTAGGKAGEEEGGGPRGRGAGRTGKKFTKSFCFALRARRFRLFSHFCRGNRTPEFLPTPHTAGQIDHLSTKSQPVLTGLDPSTAAPEGFEWYR